MINSGIVSLSDYDEISHLDALLEKIDWSKYSNKRILITGSNGMLGQCLSKLLTRAFFREFVNFQSLTLAARNWQNERQDSSLGNKVSYVINKNLREAQDSYDIVFHLASPSNISKIIDFEETLAVNCLPWIEVEKASLLIYISSGEVYLGRNTSIEPDISNFNINSPRGIYPFAKFKAEKYFSDIAERKSMELTVIRLFHTFGPGLDPRDGRSFADFIWRAAYDKNLVLHSTGEQVRSFLYIVDACLGIFQAVAQQGAKKVYNLGSPIPISILEFAKTVASFADVELEFQDAIMPQSPFGEIVPNMNALTETGWKPNYDMNFAIANTVKWAASCLKS